jgi:hypothetical protein
MPAAVREEVALLLVEDSVEFSGHGQVFQLLLGIQWRGASQKV